MTKTIDVNRILSKNARTIQFDDYLIISCKPITGILYLVNNYISGHIRVRGKDNGQYPYNYKKMIHNIFGIANNAIEVCSNSIIPDDSEKLTTVDIKSDVGSNFVADAQDMSSIFADKTFDRWYGDPPYNEENAFKMYDVRLPKFQKLLSEAC